LIASQTNPICVRPAKLQSDRAALIELFRQCLTSDYDGRRFDWLYLDGPHGVAKAWVAEHAERGEIVGAAAGFPRKMYFDGTEIAGLVFGDFCMGERFRSLGPALQLQRACLEAAQDSPFEFFYDFPSAGMMAVYKRLGLLQSGELRRWAKPIRSEGVIQRAVKSERIARGLAKVVNFSMAHRGWKGSKNSCELSSLKGRCGEEFTVFDGHFREQPGLRTSRTAEYLNWRYLAHPSTNHEIVTASRKGQLVGYVVFANHAEDPAIVDLCAEEDAIAASLLDAAATSLRNLGAATISLNAGGTHPWNSLFERTGFRQRESSPTMLYASRAGRVSEASLRQRWYLMRGERDC
jgi:hypothetical protein